jgi:hypothetical protein
MAIGMALDPDQPSREAVDKQDSATVSGGWRRLPFWAASAQQRSIRSVPR